MKNEIKFLFFLIYIVLIFLINDIKTLTVFIIINTVLILIKKIRIIEIIKNLKEIFFIILLTGTINCIVVSMGYGILIILRLILVCNATYIYSKSITYMEFAQVIEHLLCPLKIFKIDTKQISIITCIAIVFIPVLKQELEELQMILKVKGKKRNIKTLKIIFTPFFTSLLQRTNEIELSLKSKAYN